MLSTDGDGTHWFQAWHRIRPPGAQWPGTETGSGLCGSPWKTSAYWSPQNHCLSAAQWTCRLTERKQGLGNCESGAHGDWEKQVPPRAFYRLFPLCPALQWGAALWGCQCAFSVSAAACSPCLASVCFYCEGKKKTSGNLLNSCVAEMQTQFHLNWQEVEWRWKDSTNNIFDFHWTGL